MWTRKAMPTELQEAGRSEVQEAGRCHWHVERCLDHSNTRLLCCLLSRFFFSPLLSWWVFLRVAQVTNA